MLEYAYDTYEDYERDSGNWTHMSDPDWLAGSEKMRTIGVLCESVLYDNTSS